MRTRLCYAALLLGLSNVFFVGQIAVLSAELEERIYSRLVVSFKSQCNKQAATLRSLEAAVKTARRELRKKEGKAAESAEKLVVEVDETEDKDYHTYSRKVMSLRIRSLTPETDGILESLAADDAASSSNLTEDPCMVTRLHLKRVDISVISLGECPLVVPDVALQSLQHDDCIAFVERDTVVHLYPTVEGPPGGNLSAVSDPEPSKTSLPYWLENTSVDRAWEKQGCVREIVVGVIDTGLAYLHPDLASNIWVNTDEIPNNGIDEDQNGYVDDVHGYDFFLKKGELSDPHGHGTHVAGIIGAIPKVTVAQGVCKSVSIAGLRFMDPQGAGATSEAIEAINYAIEMDFHLTCNSWGGPEVSSGLQQAIAKASAVDQLFVAAAGNSGNSTDERPEYPAAYKIGNIISVAATDESDRLANFSNYGSNSVHVAAPGVFITSTYPPATSKSLSGTSMAAPVIAGVSAMMLSVRPMAVQELKKILLSTVDRPRTLKNRLISEGRVNAAFAVCKTAETEPKKKRSLATWISRLLRRREIPKADFI